MKAWPAALRRVLLKTWLAPWAAGPTVSSQQNQAAACAIAPATRAEEVTSDQKGAEEAERRTVQRTKGSAPVHQGLDTAGREGLTLEGQEQDTESRGEASRGGSEVVLVAHRAHPLLAPPRLFRGRPALSAPGLAAVTAIGICLHGCPARRGRGGQERAPGVGQGRRGRTGAAALHQRTKMIDALELNRGGSQWEQRGGMCACTAVPGWALA